MGKSRRLQVQSVQEGEVCSCLGQERGETLKRAGQADGRIARSDGAELAMVAVLDLWEGAVERARLAKTEKMESLELKSALRVEAVER